MHIEVGVDTRGDPRWHRGHGHPFVGKRVGWHHTCRDDGQDSDGPRRQAPSRSLRPTGGCRVSLRTRPTDRFQDNPAKVSAGKLGTDLVRTLTRTLTLTTTAMVDPANAHPDPRCRLRAAYLRARMSTPRFVSHRGTSAVSARSTGMKLWRQ
jgi:hypothetical protein